MLNKKYKNIFGLDAIRFFCSMYVMLFHLAYWISVPDSTPYRLTEGVFNFPWSVGVMSPGRMSVQTFFVISGFVIAYSAGRATAGSFLRSRVLRLAPAAWVCATTTLVVAILVNDRSTGALIAAWVRSVLFIPIGEHIDGTYWTLAIECSFYAMVFVLITLRSFNKIEPLFLIIATISLVYCVASMLQLGWFDDKHERFYKLSLMENGGEFAVGIFLWAILFKGPTALRILGLFIGLGAGGVETMASMPRVEDAWTGFFLWMGSILVIALSVVFNEAIGDRLGDFGRKLLRSVGLMTYPLYLLHQLVGSALMGVLAIAGLPHLACLWLTVAAMCGAAYLVCMVAEPAIAKLLSPPLKALERGIDSKLPPQAAASIPA